MAEHDEVYDDARADRLAEMLRALAERIRRARRGGQLLGGVPELLRLMGDARSEMFHYEVRSTYDTPEVADSRRIVDEAQRQDSFHPDERGGRRTMAAAPVGMKRFYTVLGAVAVIGLGLAGLSARQAGHGEHSGERHDPAVRYGRLPRLREGRPTTPPVEITEYADYQCPFCQTFATLQMPTIEERLIKTGRLRWRYRDFPLQQHQFSRIAAHSAACADEQGKFWPQHERIYEGQSEWAAARDAAAIFRRYAGEVGLDLGKYDACMSAGKYAGRIQASLRRGRTRGRELDARRCSWGAGSTRAASIPTPSPDWSIRSRPAPAPSDLSHGRGAHESARALRLRLPLSLQDRPDRDAGLRHGRLRDGADQPVEPVRRASRWRSSAWSGMPRCWWSRSLALQPAPAGRRVAGGPARGAGRGRGALHGLSDLSRAVRHPRHLPLVRRARPRSSLRFSSLRSWPGAGTVSSLRTLRRAVT